MFRVWLIALLSVCAIAAAVLVASEIQRNTAEEAFDEAEAANQALIGMLGQEDGLTDFVASGEQEAFAVYLEGKELLRTNLRKASELSRHDATETALLAEQRDAARRWERTAQQLIAERRRGEGSLESPGLRRLDVLVDEFVDANRAYQRRLETVRSGELHRAALVPLWMVLGLSVFFGSIAFLIVRRQRRITDERRRHQAEERAAEQAFVASQSRFAEAMQVAQDQAEAHRVLKRHLEERVDDSSVVVLNRNNSADRLEPSENLSEDHPLAKPLSHAAPRSCLAVRLSRHYERGGEKPEILECEVCGALPGGSTCQPLLVGGEVIGSVLVAHKNALKGDQGRRIDDSVTQAAPVLANLRNLAIAETRAATDSLTGLPNKRALDDAFKGMLAHAGRNLSQLSIVMVDVDHFKGINDNFGHERGDEVLAALGVLLRSHLRASDLPARSGGDEFIALLPDTDRAGALKIAEEIRLAVHGLKIGGLDRPVTASLGIATYPDDSTDGDHLMRTADRALYVAKQRGRDRVETASKGERADLPAREMGNGAPARPERPARK
jgi:diguanylate cyclase (GGDEF)-like protein